MTAKIPSRPGRFAHLAALNATADTPRRMTSSECRESWRAAYARLGVTMSERPLARG